MKQVIFMEAFRAARVSDASAPRTDPTLDAPMMPMAARRPIAAAAVSLRGGSGGRVGCMHPSVHVEEHRHFVYDGMMDVEDVDLAVSSIAGAIGEPARARMLFCLMD